jgi:glycosyltransferase involved in cell wall biosynthesis
MRKKLLIVSDSISASTGLARIARDLAVRIHANLRDVYDLAVAGYGGVGSCKFGFPQYHFEGVQSDWVLPSLPEIVEDFAGKERCAILFISDPSRLGWFSQPERLGGEALAKFPGLKNWLMTANIEKMIYAPVDASGPNDRLSFPLALTLLGFDRILAYGAFGEGVICRSIGDVEADKRHLTNLPHGIDSSIFYPRDRFTSRTYFLQDTGAQSILQMLGVSGATTAPIADDETLIGICATNQSRKDWSLGLECCSILSRKQKIRVWCHKDSLERFWSLPSLLIDYGLIDKAIVSLGQIPDESMASAYSASDLSFGIGPEGYGFCLAESMACGTPCITGSYANNPALVHPDMLIDPVAFRYEGSYASRRPVYRAEDWAAKAEEWIGKRASLDPRYCWENLWKNEWEPYLREAAK